jgi:hypothetical protein
MSLTQLFTSVIDPAVKASGICTLYVRNGMLSQEQHQLTRLLEITLLLLALKYQGRNNIKMVMLAVVVAKIILRVPEACENYRPDIGRTL